MAPRPFFEALKKLCDRTDVGVRFLDEHVATKRISYAKLIEKARFFASALWQRGVKSGEPVVLVMTIPETAIIAILGCMIAGCPPTPVYPPQNLKSLPNFLIFLQHVIERSSARFIVADSGPFPVLGSLKAKMQELRGIEKFERMTADRAATFPATQETSTAFLQFTSGSTGTPKGVIVTYEGLSLNHWMIRSASKMDEKSCVVTWLPVYHDMGLIGTVLNAITLPCELVVIPPIAFLKKPKLWLEAITKFRGTHTAAPNFAYGLCAKRIPDTGGLDLRSMTTFICGAEPVLPKTMEAFVQHYSSAGLDPRAMVPAYGLAEGTLAVTFTPYMHGLRIDTVNGDLLSEGKAVAAGRERSRAVQVVSSGLPMDGISLRISSESGAVLEERRVGEIQIQGPTVTPGYIGDEDASAKSRTADGWLHTGDLGYIANGELYVCGRIKDVIIIRGKNFHAHDIETVVSDIPGVRTGNVVAFGLQEERGESLVIVAETREEKRSEQIAQQIRGILAASIGITPANVLIVPVGTLPKTSSGKLKRSETRRLYLEESLQKGKFSDIQTTIKSGFSYLRNRFSK